MRIFRASRLQALGSDTVVESALSHLSQDEDVLDTWFSSAL